MVIAREHALSTPLVILASASPRRQMLLDQVGIPYRVIPSSAVELQQTGGARPETVAIENARRKAADVAACVDSGLVLGADTIVCLDGQILGKPSGPEQAASMLRALSGREHVVMTGIALCCQPSGAWKFGCETTSVQFKTLHPDEIAAYIASGEPLDKAGAYGIQGRAGLFIARISGCYGNVVGLPLGLLRDLLRELGHTPWTRTG